MLREEALQALVAAQDVDEQVRRRGRWYALYATVYGFTTFGCTLTLGMFPEPAAVAVVMPLWLVAVVGLSVYAGRQPVMPRRFSRTHNVMIAAWGLVYSVTVIAGAMWFPGALWWWGTGAVLCAVPPFVAARIALNAAREPRA